tara:strand:+ start:205 stop:366 length:162 start_codon:yes stop_codon:yes gene_type:complete
MSDYFDSIAGEIVSKNTVRKMLKEHDAYMAELIEDLGDKDEYEADDVIGWLGY